MKQKYLDKDLIDDIEDKLDKFSFEKYCGACEYFETEDCKHLGEVSDNTIWTTKPIHIKSGDMRMVQCNDFYN